MDTRAAYFADRAREGAAALARSSVALLCALLVVLPGSGAFASERLVTISIETVEYTDYGYYDGGADGFEADDGGYFEAGYGAARDGASLAAYGPFRVVSADTAELAGDTDSYSPDDFRAMLAAWPGLQTLRLVECGGTVDDTANLALARLIRRAGLDTHVPANGSVRSGGVELFLAGVHRSAEPGAEFLVHSWRDELGREARDVPLSDPIHADYLAYYRDMGLAPDTALSFYALTNSAPNDGARRLTLGELAAFRLLN